MIPACPDFLFVLEQVRPILRVDEVKETLPVKTDFIQRVAQHAGPTRTAQDLAGGDIPVPEGILTAFEDELQAFLAFTNGARLLG